MRRAFQLRQVIALSSKTVFEFGIFSFSKRFKTIYALSSGSLPSAIAVVRISGEASENALRKLTRRTSFEPMNMFYSRLFDEDGNVLDKAMACFMKGPKTFTGEDCAELYLHGSKAVVNAVFKELAKISSLESAKAGEFSKRAFYNGKMDVLQVEALAGLINAESEAQRILALRQAKSGKYLRALRTRIVNLSADMEASIDFGEELASGATIDNSQLIQMAKDIRCELTALNRAASRGTLISRGIHVALVGRTNVGKSSIMNRLAERDVAIVSNTPGTTRDSIQLRIHLGHQIVNVTDTAGIRDTDDSLEREGIRRSIQKAEEANIVVLVLDEHDRQSVNEEIKFLLSRINFNPILQSLVVCINKRDLLSGASFPFVEALLTEKSDKARASLSTVWTSCQEDDGLDTLTEWLENLISRQLHENNLLTEDGNTSNEIMLSGNRHIELLERALSEIEMFSSALEELNDSALAAEHLRGCAAAVGEIAGSIVSHEVMERLFSTMCVGK